MHSLSFVFSDVPCKNAKPGRVLGSACEALAKEGHFNPTPTKPAPVHPQRQAGCRLQRKGQLWTTLSKAGVRCVYITRFFKKKKKVSVDTTLWEVFLLEHFCLFLFNLMTILNGSQPPPPKKKPQRMSPSACLKWYFDVSGRGKLLRILETLRKLERIKNHVAFQLVRSFF